MAYTNNDRSSRQMYTGNWKCSKCNKAITELPFEPAEDKIATLKCLDCFRSERGDRPSFGGRNNQGPRRMFQGNWTCSSCGAAINQLPFEPRDTSNLKCRNCFQGR